MGDNRETQATLEMLERSLQADVEAIRLHRHALEQLSRRRAYLRSQLEECNAQEHRILSRLYNREKIERELLIVRVARKLVDRMVRMGLPIVGDPRSIVRSLLDKGNENEGMYQSVAK